MVEGKGTGEGDLSLRDKSREVVRGLLKLLQDIIRHHRIALSFIAGGVILYFATPSPTTILAGIPFIFTGEALRTWASGFIKKDKELTQWGPYALSRNPLYLGNFLIGIGFSIVAGNLLLFLLFLIAFTLIYTVTIKNEESRLLARFGYTFIEYRGRVPVFFPIPPFSKHTSPSTVQRGNNDNRSFDWQLVLGHREHHTWLGILGCLAIFIIKASFFTID